MQQEQSLLNDEVLNELVQQCRQYTKDGAPASYIPMLQRADAAKLGICVADQAGGIWQGGDAKDIFTIQSIVKILMFTCSLLDSGADLVSQIVSVEPTSDGFNSITSLETKNNSKPLNPMINAGAIACLTLVAGATLELKYERILAFTRELAGNAGIAVDEAVYLSEKQTGSRNRALAHFMKSTGILDDSIDVEELLDAYFRICSILVSCQDLARIALIYAGNGHHPVTGREYFSKHIARSVKAAMVMCGMYDESGRVAVRIGLPTKSGVGGGILSIVPEQYGIGIYGPALNEKGSSIAGLVLLEKLSHYLDVSIF